MALTLTSAYIANADHVPAGNPIIFTFESDDGQVRAMELTVKKGATEIATLRKQPDIGETDIFTFDLSDVIQDNLSFVIPSTSMTTQEESNGYGSFTFEGKELLENASTGLIEDGASLGAGDIRTFFAHNSLLQHPSLQATREDDLSNYVLDSAPNTTGKFLTAAPLGVVPAYRYYKASTTDEIYLSFIGDMDQITKVTANTVDASGSTINQFNITFAQAGYDRSVFRAGYARWAGLHAQFAVDMTSGGGVRYDMFLSNAGSQQMSEFLTVHIVSDCSRKATRLQWINDLGGLDAWTFYGNPIYTHQVSGSAYEKLADAPQSTINTYDGGATVMVKTAREQIKTVSFKVTANEVRFFESLLRSPQVYLEDSGTFRAVTLGNKTLKVEDYTKNVYRLSFTIDQSNVFKGLRN